MVSVRIKHIFVLLISILVVNISFGQTDESDYVHEFNYGINFNTNGGLIGGFQMKWGKIIGESTYHSLGVEVVNVKHPKEIRYTSQLTGNSFILFKTNYLFPVRLNYGREYVMFRKASQNGVQINSIFAAGPTIGFVKPYYIVYGFSQFATSEPYNPAIHTNPQFIQGPGSFTDGFDRLSIVPGVHAKLALSFEFGAFNNNVIGVEAGLLTELYTQEVYLMAGPINRSHFSSAFFTIYYGNKY